MRNLPDDVACTTADRRCIYGLCRDVANEALPAASGPDVIDARVCGGRFAGRGRCDRLGADAHAGHGVFDPEFVGEHLVGWVWNPPEDAVGPMEAGTWRTDGRFDRTDGRHLPAAERDVQRTGIERRPVIEPVDDPEAWRLA
jgi:hypothetical protein